LQVQITKDQAVQMLATIEQVATELEKLHDEGFVSEQEQQDALDSMNELKKQLSEITDKPKYISISNNFNHKIYLATKKNKHPERTRFNPLIVENEDFEKTLKSLCEKSKEDPSNEYVVQCLVNAGHATMIELRVKNGNGTAIIIDAAEAFQQAEQQYIPLLSKYGFNVKIFVSNFDHNKLLSPQILSGPIDFFRRIKPLRLQNDYYSCERFAVHFMVQAGKTDLLQTLGSASIRSRAYMQRAKLGLWREALTMHKRFLNPLNITLIPFSTLPDNFIKIAQSSRIIASRRGLADKFAKQDEAPEKDKPLAGKYVDKLRKKTENTELFVANFTVANVLFAALPTSANLNEYYL
jgi:hypothetical protein